MRKLHPVGPQEELLEDGRFRRADGTVEQWTTHALPGERCVVRVEVDDGALWHVMVGPDGVPERLQVRLPNDGRPVEETYTFFEDEVLVWRRGAEPASEAQPLPPGYRVLWPPVAGRGRCLRGLGADGPQTLPVYVLTRRPADEGGLVGQVREIAVRRMGRALVLEDDDGVLGRAEHDAKGRLVTWVGRAGTARRMDTGDTG